MGRRETILLVILSAALCAAWTVFAGKDLNWDQLNYHYYLPFELLERRWGQDYFAASAQSYLNPIGYLPFYLMVSEGWHSVLASLVLAVLHSGNVALLYVLGWRLFSHLPRRQRAEFGVLAAALGVATAVFWTTVGSSFLDPLLGAPMLGGLLLLLDGGRHAQSRAALAGALFGTAAALKYSNAIFALAALPLVAALPGTAGASRLRACLAYAGGGGLAVALFAGPWLWLMHQEFGNPVFPLMNAWFESPHAPPVNLVGERFAPRGLGEALAFPFRMAALDRNLYVEIFAPDLRFAALFLAASALPVLAALRRLPAAARLQGADWRVFGFAAASYALWLGTSANGRYGLPVLLLAGVCLARLAERVLPASLARIALAVLLALQLAASIGVAPVRWYIAAPWSRHWLHYAAPERALREPALYVTIETLPMAVVAPFVHPDSAFVNLRGQHSLPTDAPRLVALLERYRGRVRALGRALALVDGRPRKAVVQAYDASLLRIGYRVQPEDCFAIPWQPGEGDALSRAANRFGPERQPNEPLSAVSCALVAAQRDPADLEEERRFSALFDRVENACPGLFRGQTAVTERLGQGWSRSYTGLDARLEMHDGWLLLNRYRTQTFFNLGSLSDWECGQAAPLPACAAK